MKTQAIEALKRAHAPYSQFHVGAAILTHLGKIYSGCNVENASYGGTLCAERVTIAKAISEGEKHISALLVTTRSPEFIFPCGICRQFISEFAHKECPIASLTSQGKLEETTLGFLLPKDFHSKYLELANINKTKGEKGELPTGPPT